jgi:type IV secretion system protein VirD4
MSDVHGSAAWSTDPGHWRYESLGTDGPPVSWAGGRFLLLGENPSAGGYMHVRAPRQHILSIAPTRSGKGVSLIIPNLLMYQGSVLVIDPKGENAWITAARRRQLGQKTYIVDPWNEVNSIYGSKAGAGMEEKSIAGFNPLSILKAGSDDFVENLAYLADALIITQSTKDPFWDDSARELCAGLMAYVVENPAFAPRASLALVRKLLMRPNEELQRTIKAAIDLGSGSVAALKLGQFENQEKTTSIASVIQAARTQTSFLDSLNQGTETSDFSFDELCGGKASVYLVLPMDKLQTHARWLRLMVSIAIRAVTRRAPAGLPVLFMLDEFGTIGKLNMVAQAYGLSAGRGMIMWTFSQDLNQLKRDYPEEWETFIGNSQAVTCFNVMDNFTTEYVSKMLGTQTIEQVNTSTSQSTSVGPPQMNAPIWASRTSRSTSINYSTQTISRPLLHPDEVCRLAGDRCIILGHFPPIMSRRIVYQQDWDLLHWAREDPYHPRTEEVRWQALQRRLRDMRSVARLLKEYDYEVKALKRGRYEVKKTDGTWTRVFADRDEIWKFTYLMVMDSVGQKVALAA